MFYCTGLATWGRGAIVGLGHLLECDGLLEGSSGAFCQVAGWSAAWEGQVGWSMFSEECSVGGECLN